MHSAGDRRNEKSGSPIVSFIFCFYPRDSSIRVKLLSFISGLSGLVPDKLNSALFWQDFFHWTQSVRYAFRRGPAERETFLILAYPV